LSRDPVSSHGPEAQAESEGIHRRLLEALTERHFFYRHDAAGRFTYLSDSVSRVLGYDPDEYREHYSGMLTDNPLNDSVVARTEAALRGERQPSYEIEVRAKDGSLRRLELTEYPVRGPDGEVAFVEGIARDVTEARRAEAARTGQARVMEMVATGSPVRQVLLELVRLVESQSPGMLASVLLLDEDGVHIRHAAASSLPAGYVAAMDGQSIGPAAGSCGTAMFLKKAVVVTDILEDPLWEPYRELAAPHGLRACWSTPILSREGAVLGSFAMYYPQPRAPGPAELRLAEMACHIAGIAIEHQRAVDALRASEEKYRTLFEEDLAANYVASPAGELITCNSAYARIFGFGSVAEAHQSNLWERFPSAQIAQSVLALLQIQGKLQAHEHQLLRRDGALLHVLGTAVGRFDDEGRLVEIHGYFVDETERRAAEDQLRQAQKIDAVGLLAGGIAHDFNNLLGVITGYCDLLLRDTEYAGRGRVDQIRKAGERAADLVRQLLAFSRKQVLEPKVLDLNRVLADIESMLRRLIGEHIQLVTAFDRELGLVKADAGQIEQVLVNLAVNARDAMPQGGRLVIKTSNVEIDEDYVRTHPGASPGPHVMLMASDTGHGMDQETQARIFEPFFTTKEPGKGTGLGLSTVYGIVKQSGGYIEVDSEPGRGASFTIYLSRVREVAATSGAAKSDEPETLGGTETILLLEDEESLRLMLSELLRAAGYEVLECDTPEAALAAAVRSPPRAIDLMLADLVMPRMSGHEVAQRIRRVHHRMKLLYMSGYSRDVLGRPGPDRDVEFIAKPFSAAALLQRVRAVLDRPALPSR
jgi:two-component system, cell cycle sensor histidine kinase and response regulator CckA